MNRISRPPNVCQNFLKDSMVVLRIPDSALKVTFSGDKLLHERIFHFSREVILELCKRENSLLRKCMDKEFLIDIEILGIPKKKKNQVEIEDSIPLHL